MWTLREKLFGVGLMSMRSEISFVSIDVTMNCPQVGNDEVTCLILAVREAGISICHFPAAFVTTKN